jgi:hypothetical protein
LLKLVLQLVFTMTVAHLERWAWEAWRQRRVHVLGVQVAQLVHQQLHKVNLATAAAAADRIQTQPADKS